jgi:L-fucose mutarotase
VLNGKLLHPTILKVLGASGHGSGILIADGNYPFVTRANPAAERVYLNLMPGLCTVTQVLEAILSVTPIEAAHVMLPDDGGEPSIHADFRRLLPGLTLTPHSRHPFYDLARGSDVSLVVATGEQRLYANILLVIGVVPPPTA